MPKVLNFKDCGYKIPDGAVYVGRGVSRYNLSASKWGNPFRIGIDGSRDEVVTKYRDYMLLRLEELGDLDTNELKGKDLVCWCAPLPCHADILLGLANQETQ